MTINALTVRTKEDNELIFAMGIEDFNTIVSFTIDRTHFSDKEIIDLEKDSHMITTTGVYFGECEVYHLAKDFQNIVIKTEKLEVV